MRAIYGVEPSRRRRAVEAPIFVELDAGLMRRIIVTPSGDVEASSLRNEASSLCIEERRAGVELFTIMSEAYVERPTPSTEAPGPRGSDHRYILVM